MNTQIKKLTTLLSIFVFLGTVVMAQTMGNEKDLQLIKNIETNWQNAWNRHDMKALAALVAEDVDFITVSGTWLKNRKDFEEHHAKRHEMQFKESIWTTTDAKVKFLKHDIAIGHVR